MANFSPQTCEPKKKGTGKSVSNRKCPDSRGGNTLLLSPGARRIVQAALREDVSVATLAELAAADPAFAVRVLSVSNSAAYSLSRSVTNIQQACALLGIRGMRNIALSMMVADLVPAAEGAGTLLSACLRRAAIARGLAEKSGLVQKDDAFFAGLLLEVGLLHQACEQFEECLEVCRSPGRYRVTRERSLGLIPHPILGGQLAQELSLPPSIGSAISQHHVTAPPIEPLALICWASEICAAVFETGDAAQNLVLAESAVHDLGLLPDELQQILEGVAAEVTELAVVLDCAEGPQSQRAIQRPAERDLKEMQVQYEQLIAVLDQVLDDRDRLQIELESAHEALKPAGFLHSSKV